MAGLANLQPTLTAAASGSRTAAETLQLADEKACLQLVPVCHVTDQIGKEWEEVDKSFSSYDVSWHPMIQKRKVPHLVNIRFGMGIEFFGKEGFVVEFETDVGSKIYIADIKITEPLTIAEDRVVDLAVNGSHSPPPTDITPLTPHAANSLAIALFDESKAAIKRNMQDLMDKVFALFDRKRRTPELINLPLHEYVACGWDATNGQWRNTVWPTLDQGFVGCPRSSAAYPAGITRPDGSHRTRVRLHLRLRENILYDGSICSKNAVCISAMHISRFVTSLQFKFQTEQLLA
ncbi:hypothetical protein C8J57DRAFT_1230952 [Mycena rebaudengoi]|nr:hypothetical protein C8J57DRAFT_1230952 [Mycena rebaudengoi]